jgi:hypothetical protein
LIASGSPDVCLYIHLAQECPAESSGQHLEGVMLSLLPEGSNEEVKDGVSTFVNTAQDNRKWMKVTKEMIKRIWKPS